MDGHFGGPGGVTVSFFGPAWGLQNHAQCEELSASGGKRKGFSGSGHALRRLRLARRPALSASASHRSLFLQDLVQLLSHGGRLSRGCLGPATTLLSSPYIPDTDAVSELLEVVTRMRCIDA